MDDLTFKELRLANMVHRDLPVAVPGEFVDFAKLPNLAQILSARRSDIARAIADMVIIADRLAAVTGIDLSQAIRDRFDPNLKEKEPRQNGVEGQRPGD